MVSQESVSAGAAPHGESQLSQRVAGRLRMASFGALTAVVLQSVLGNAYGLYGTAPTPGHSVGMFSSVLLAFHVVVGILLLVSAIVLVVRAIAARHRIVLVSSIVALVAVIGAFVGGTTFLKQGDNAASMGMAVAAAIALLCYGINIVVLGSSRSR